MEKFNYLRKFYLVLVTAFGLAYSLAAQAKTLNVVTDIAPVQAIVSGLISPQSTSIQLVSTAISSHDFALKPSQIRAVQQADLIIWLGPIATPGLARLMAQPAIAAKAITLNELPKTHLLKELKPGLFNPAIPRKTRDPHSWLDPDNAVYWSQEIARALTRLDPKHSAAYLASAQAQSEKINNQKAEINVIFGTADLLPYVQFHEAFQYFEEEFNLHPMGAATTSDPRATSLGVTTELRAELQKTTRSCLLVRDQRQADQAAPFRQISGVKLGFVDPLGADIGKVNFSYTSLLAKISTGFLACLTTKP
ncbi:MAG: zinc ABC transporter solute-binding protein [Alphaproteobacteria bacterium]|nr:zinc ABC transporter solute-binding protein [Alphaproteobacteria bacterium]